MKGFKQFGFLLCTGLIGFLVGVIATMQTPSLSASETTGHAHTLTAHQQINATCTQAGTRAYWECETCNLFFTDVNGINEIDLNEFITWKVLPKLNHQTNENYHVAYQQPTCASNGNQEYYMCINGCGQYFQDQHCQILIPEKNVTIKNDKARHTLTLVEAKTATCTEAGHIQHYNCTTCHKNFSDIYGTQINNVTTTVDHDLTYVDATNPTCFTDGEYAHYHCKNCHQDYSDVTCTDQMTTTVIPHLEHSSYASHYVAYQAPTCETAGHHAYYLCEHGCGLKFKEVTCDNLYTANELTIPAYGHSWTYVKADENQTAKYECDTNGKFQHGWIKYDIVCTHDGCDGYNGSKEFCGFARLDKTNNTKSKVTHTIDYLVQDETLQEVYDLFTLDWNQSTIAYDDQNQAYTTITLKLADTYNTQAKYSYQDATNDLNTIIDSNRLSLTVYLNAKDANDMITWRLDWDADGIYEQTIKVAIQNY